MRATLKTLNPFFWLLPFLLAWALLAGQPVSLKTASGQNSGLDTASTASPLWQAAPRLSFSGLTEKEAAGPLVGVKGGGVGVNSGTKLASVEVDIAKASKGTPEYNILNEPPPNSQVKLSNGTEFKTNSNGYVDEITYSPSLSQGVRDARQTAVGKEGLPTDVGGHVQGCQFGGTCDRFNLFPQDSNFNNSAYKRFENEIKGALNNGDQVGSVTVRFNRTDPISVRPDSLTIDYSINGVPKQRFFENKAGQ